MTPQNIPFERVRIFKRDGTSIAEFNAKVERSWAIGDEGRAQFTYATRITDIVNETVLQYGNWLLVENSMLPDWVGVIDTPRSWTARTVTVSAYTPEHVFGWRRGPFEVAKSGSAGSIFEYLLQLVNSAEPTIIKAGSINKSGTNRQETINPTQLNTDLQRIYERSLEEYQWRPIIEDSGRLAVLADWMPHIGITTTALLHEGKAGGNIETVNNILVEDGTIKNDVLGYGDGLTWASKPKQQIIDPFSRFKYGLRQWAEGFDGVTNGQTLKDNTIALVNDESNPKKTFSINALNVEDTFKYIGLGNTLNLQFQNIGFYNNGSLGFETKVRITAMRYDPVYKNKIELTVEVTE